MRKNKQILFIKFYVKLWYVFSPFSWIHSGLKVILINFDDCLFNEHPFKCKLSLKLKSGTDNSKHSIFKICAWWRHLCVCNLITQLAGGKFDSYCKWSILIIIPCLKDMYVFLDVIFQIFLISNIAAYMHNSWATSKH